MAPILSGQVEGRRRPKMAILGSAQLPAETSIPSAVSTAPVTNLAPRHSALVRFTHWITTICFSALLLTGIEIVISHPRFYWGETGTVLTKPLFQLPIPSSRRLEEHTSELQSRGHIVCRLLLQKKKNLL